MIVTGILFLGCEEDFLDKQPLDQLSSGTFWQTENDALLALVGVYNHPARYSDGQFRYYFMGFWTHTQLDNMTDNGYDKDKRLIDFNKGTMEPSNRNVREFWGATFKAIAKANNFLDNIDQVVMDEGKRAEFIAEVRFIRAFYYFSACTYWGGVPLVTTTLTLDEANNITRATRDEVINFCFNELTQAAADLPATRPDEEQGRITKATALAILGRALMAEQRWTEAAQIYKSIMDMGLYEIDPRWKELFEDAGETSPEIIFSLQYVDNVFPTRVQQTVVPFQMGGWHQISVFNELVQDFELTDGLVPAESPNYDWTDPFKDRDPRLYMTVFLDGITEFRGQIYSSDPLDQSSNDRLLRRDWSGHALHKFADEDYTGPSTEWGGDFPMIRYAEILLSYLESKLEAGDAITQALLDETINQIRLRPSVNMPPVTETNPDLLREDLRRERRVEFAFEGLRYFDLLRWDIIHINMNSKFHGMKLTNDPANYTFLPVDDQGFYDVTGEESNFRVGTDELWPIPQSELDINPNLTQNPGY